MNRNTITNNDRQGILHRWRSTLLCAFGIICIITGLLLPGCGSDTLVIRESEDSIANWSLARDYQAQGRYELARQHYLLALASSRTAQTQSTLQRELDSLDRKIAAKR